MVPEKNGSNKIYGQRTISHNLIGFHLFFKRQALQPSMAIVGIYCGVIAAMFLLLKAVNFRLHHTLDEGEVVHQAKESQGSRGGTEGANDVGVTRRQDSNGPG